MKRWLVILLIAIVVIPLLVFTGLAYYFHSKITDADTVVYTEFPLPEGKNTIICFFAHPDDETAVSGTLYKIASNPDNKLIGVYLTRGGAGPTGGLVSQEELADERSRELENVGKILGFDELIFLDLPDGGIKNIDPLQIRKSIKALIVKYNANIVISYDDKVGLYGHIDHLLTGKYTREAFIEEKDNPSFPAKKMYCCTLGERMIETAIELSSAFKKNYPKEKEKGLPKPDFAVFIGDVGYPKVNAIAAHRTQKQVFDDVLPLHDRIPAWIYFRVFDREYFTELETRP